MIAHPTWPLMSVRWLRNGLGAPKRPRAPVPLVFTFPKGKIYATAHVNFNWVPDVATCTVTRHGTSSFTITRGTGVYHGITGKGRYVENGAAIGVHDRNGGCVQRFKLNYVIAHLTATATF